MSASMIRSAVRAGAGALFVTAVVILEIELRLANTLALCSFVTAAFVLVAIVDRHWTAMVAIAVGSLEAALALPGGGLAVNNSDDALGFVLMLGTGLLVAWFSRREGEAARRAAAGFATAEIERDRSADLVEELIHRLSNDFMLLIATANMIARRSENRETRDAMTDLSGRVVLLSRMYRRFWTRGADGQGVSMASYLDELCEDLRTLRFGSRPIVLQLDVGDIRLPLPRAAIIGLITNELLTNVYKHAFPDDRAGLVTVSLRRHATKRHTLNLEVVDDGIGFRDNEARDTAAGHRLLGSLAMQISGELHLARISGRTIASVQFPEIDGKSKLAEREEEPTDAAALQVA